MIIVVNGGHSDNMIDKGSTADYNDVIGISITAKFKNRDFR